MHKAALNKNRGAKKLVQKIPFNDFISDSTKIKLEKNNNKFRFP